MVNLVCRREGSRRSQWTRQEYRSAFVSPNLRKKTLKRRRACARIDRSAREKSKRRYHCRGSHFHFCYHKIQAQSEGFWPFGLVAQKVKNDLIVRLHLQLSWHDKIQRGRALPPLENDYDSMRFEKPVMPVAECGICRRSSAVGARTEDMACA